MGLIEAIDLFLAEGPDTPPTNDPIALLKLYLSTTPRSSPSSPTAQLVSHFLGNWYLSRYVGRAAGSEQLPEPEAIVAALTRLLDWMARRGGLNAGPLAAARAALEELSVTLPRAIEISRRLAESLSVRRGAFEFREFLTTFENGGQSRYDPDPSTEPSLKEGYFTINRIQGSRIEAEESISEEPVWPIVFPEPAARLLSPGYIVNLEIVCNGEYWEPIGCGLAHPPETPVP